MEGWVGLIGWPIADTLPTKWSHVNHILGIDQRKFSSHRSTFWPLSHAVLFRLNKSCIELCIFLYCLVLLILIAEWLKLCHGRRSTPLTPINCLLIMCCMCDCSAAKKIFDASLRIIFGSDAVHMSLLYFLHYISATGGLDALISSREKVGGQEFRVVVIRFFIM